MQKHQTKMKMTVPIQRIQDVSIHSWPRFTRGHPLCHQILVRSASGPHIVREVDGHFRHLRHWAPRPKAKKHEAVAVFTRIDEFTILYQVRSGRERERHTHTHIYDINVAMNVCLSNTTLIRSNNNSASNVFKDCRLECLQ